MCISQMKRTVVIVVLVALIGGGAGFALGYTLGPGDRVKVPNLVGLGKQRGGQGEARPVLKDAGLRLGVVRFMASTDSTKWGKIIRQVPDAGTSVPVGATVDIYVAVVDDGMGP
jgi:beta-lactam-binding protein with PASTA domain